MRWTFVTSAGLFLAACSSEQEEPAEEPATFVESPYRYCLDRDDRWLMDQMARVSQAWPDDFEVGSLSYERLHVSDNWLDDVLDSNSKEIMVRYTAIRNGEPVDLFTLAEIDPEDCSLSRMEASIGLDRFQDRGVEGFPVP